MPMYFPKMSFISAQKLCFKTEMFYKNLLWSVDVKGEVKLPASIEFVDISVTLRKAGRTPRKYSVVNLTKDLVNSDDSVRDDSFFLQCCDLLYAQHFFQSNNRISSVYPAAVCTALGGSRDKSMLASPFLSMIPVFPGRKAYHNQGQPRIGRLPG